jgi:hypothetical protein
MKANQPTWSEATTHNPENMSDEQIEEILIELKGKAAPVAKKK